MAPRKRRLTYGKGTVFKRSYDDRWIGRVTVDGKRVQVSGKTKGEARTKLRAKVDESISRQMS